MVEYYITVVTTNMASDFTPTRRLTISGEPEQIILYMSDYDHLIGQTSFFILFPALMIVISYCIQQCY